MNYFKFKTVAKQNKKNKTEQKNKKRAEDLPVAYLDLPGGPAAAQHCWPSPAVAPIVFNLLRVGRRACGRRAWAHARHLLLHTAAPTRLDDATHPFWNPSLTLSSPSSPLLSLPLCPSGARRHRRRSPRPQPPPCFPSASLSSVPTPWSYTPDARDQRRPQSTGASSSSSPVPEIAAVNSPSQKLPRARRPLRLIHCESRRLFPSS